MADPFTRRQAMIGDPILHRICRTNPRMSCANSAGASNAAPWPMRSGSFQWISFGKNCSTQSRGAGRSSRGNMLTPTSRSTTPAFFDAPISACSA